MLEAFASGGWLILIGQLVVCHNVDIVMVWRLKNLLPRAKKSSKVGVLHTAYRLSGVAVPRALRRIEM